MKIIIHTLTILLILIIVFITFGFVVSRHNLKKNKYDLLNYLKNHKEILSITLKENGQDTLAINPNKKIPLASTLKIIIAFNFVKCAMNNKFSVVDKVRLSELEKLYIKDTDGGAHSNWKKSINSPTEVSLLEVAKGMMQFSSNACTDFLIDKIGVDVINKSIEALQLNHDKITYLTPSVLIPGYLSDKRKLAINKIAAMNKQSYQNLSSELFEKMKADESGYLEKKATKMLDQKMQLLITNKMASSTTKQYADLMYKLGNELLTEEEKEIFSEILIGKSIKSNYDDYLWYKGGSTLFVLTSALYKESQNTTLSFSLFIKDDTGGELYWIRNIFNDFVISVATDAEFRKKVREMAN
ncbi:serine hydrolase [Lentibacillus sp. L22]|uniref:serine hydrolase n=1 Tax=Lentibacillus TaxID=175304 RepID=UPI0022B0C2DF|nr:serine hydrolase [Lentibacillus daqui]